MRNRLQQWGTYEVFAMSPSDNGIFSRRLMQYVYHQRHLPSGQVVSYWRKCVAEYYFSSCQENGGDLRQFLRCFHPLIKINFEGGVIDGLLFVNLPHERKFSSGLMMPESEKAIRKNVYE